VHARRYVAVAALVVALSVATSAGNAGTAESDLATTLRAALAQPGVDARRTAALAIDLRSGETVLELNARRALVPASTEKLGVSLAALKVFGPRYRFRTTVFGEGHRDDAAWRGDLYLVGGGDPTLATRDLDRLARRIAALGIRRVAGRILGDESLFDTQRAAPGWKPSYVGDESAPVSALSVAGARGAGSNGSAAAAAQAFTQALSRRGVAVAGTPGTGRAPLGAVALAEDASPPLRLVIRLMNRDSDNFTSELVLKSLGTVTGERGSFAGGAAAVRSALRDADVPVSGVRVVDGSGLSALDRTTALALVAILRAGLADADIRDAFVGSLAVAGVSGTLKRRLERPPARGRVLAKTGTTSRASALAGFVRRDYAFAVIQNGSPVPYWSARSAQDRFATVLARS
jgi:D-alanyl-D-alanine carboxypeptidase/D-alanyl-D-alanine-endopeptidase (penicillin-binding protein 4)